LLTLLADELSGMILPDREGSERWDGLKGLEA
jgi:hypothetical protein